VLWSLIKIVAVVLPLLLCVAYLTLWERKAIGWSQVRPGPNRVGPWGLLTPIADAVKLIFKEIIRPTAANKGLFFLAPVMTIMPALAAWAVVPFGPDVALANINAGLLFLMAITSLEVYGVIIAGWASNSKYAFPGCAACFGPDGQLRDRHGLLPGGGADGAGQHEPQRDRHGPGPRHFAGMGVGLLSWNWLPLLPIFVVFFISGLAETNRHPFDVVEGESEIVAGHMIEYSGMSFAMFFLAEYANMILVSMLCGAAVPGRLAAAVRLPGLHPRLDLAGDQGVCRGHHVPVGAGHLPALPLRPDHASGLEDLHPHHAGLAGRRRPVDPVALQHLEVTWTP
jgi:NADH-quinone oxidoreductase subunit H